MESSARNRSELSVEQNFIRDVFPTAYVKSNRVVKVIGGFGIRNHDITRRINYSYIIYVNSIVIIVRIRYIKYFNEIFAEKLFYQKVRCISVNIFVKNHLLPFVRFYGFYRYVFIIYVLRCVVCVFYINIERYIVLFVVKKIS